MHPFIIDSVVAICDRLVAALKLRELGRRNFFEDHARPVFEQIVRVHEDYMRACIDIASIIADEATTPDRVLDAIATKRDVYDHLRRLIWDLAVTLKDPKYVGRRPPTTKQLRNHALRRKEAAYMFSSAVSRYFQCCTTHPPGRRGSTVFAGLINLVEIWSAGGFSRSECADAVRAQRRPLANRWAEVSKTYTQLRAMCL